MKRFTIIATLAFQCFLICLVGCSPMHTINGNHPTLEDRVYMLESKMENNAKIAIFNTQMDNALRNNMQAQIDSLYMVLEKQDTIQDLILKRLEDGKTMDDLNVQVEVISRRLLEKRLDSLISALRKSIIWGDQRNGWNNLLLLPQNEDIWCPRWDTLNGLQNFTDSVSKFVPDSSGYLRTGEITNLIRGTLIDSSSHPGWLVVMPENFHAAPGRPQSMGPKKQAKHTAHAKP